MKPNKEKAKEPAAEETQEEESYEPDFTRSGETTTRPTEDDPLLPEDYDLVRRKPLDIDGALAEIAHRRNISIDVIVDAVYARTGRRPRPSLYLQVSQGRHDDRVLARDAHKAMLTNPCDATRTAYSTALKKLDANDLAAVEQADNVQTVLANLISKKWVLWDPWPGEYIPVLRWIANGRRASDLGPALRSVAMENGQTIDAIRRTIEGITGERLPHVACDTATLDDMIRKKQTDSEIGYDLGISETTVRKRRRALAKKEV